MEEFKKAIVIAEMTYTIAEFFCPHCDKEKSFIWDTAQDSVILQCPGCFKMYEVSRK